jgi:hypothetical protein
VIVDRILKALRFPVHQSVEIRTQNLVFDSPFTQIHEHEAQYHSGGVILFRPGASTNLDQLVKFVQAFERCKIHKEKNRDPTQLQRHANLDFDPTIWYMNLVGR